MIIRVKTPILILVKKKIMEKTEKIDGAKKEEKQKKRKNEEL